MNQHLPFNGKPIKALGSSLPYDLIYTTDAKEAMEKIYKKAQRN